MSRLTRLVATACCAASATATAGCVHGVTYRMPMPSSLTLGTIRGDESPRVASAVRPARQEPATTRPAAGDGPQSVDGDRPATVSMASK